MHASCSVPAASAAGSLACGLRRLVYWATWFARLLKFRYYYFAYPTSHGTHPAVESTGATSMSFGYHLLFFVYYFGGQQDAHAPCCGSAVKQGPSGGMQAYHFPIMHYILYTSKEADIAAPKVNSVDLVSAAGSRRRRTPAHSTQPLSVCSWDSKT